MITIRRMTRAEAQRITEIDRSEHITTLYQMNQGELVSRSVDFNDQGWNAGDGEHSFGRIIEHAEHMLDAQGTMLGAFDGSRLAAVAVFRPRLTETLGELALLHASCAYRRQGLATRLLCEAERLAMESGATELYVSATPTGSAIGFYTRHGFRPTPEPHPELLALEPEDIHMTKSL